MGRTSKILTPADIREKKREARAILSSLKGTLKGERTELKTARADLKKASTVFGKAERTVSKSVRAVAKQQEKIDALVSSRAS